MPDRPILVTVTYGDRLGFLKRLLNRVLGEGAIARAIVVSNGSTSPLEELQSEWGDQVRLVLLQSNRGSAEGFAAGIRAALEDGATQVLLMDDDNAPYVGSIGRLRSELEKLVEEHGSRQVAVLAFREDHQPEIAKGLPAKLAYPLSSSFLGVDVRLLAMKLWRKFIKGPTAPVDACCDVPFAPYGGLLINREAIELIGLPAEKFVLYGDDTEYTLRLTRAGGRIRLVRDAPVEDLERSWNAKLVGRSSFSIYLTEGSPLRSYYSLRNRAWIDRHVRCRNLIVYGVNRLLFISMLGLHVRGAEHRSRFDLIRRAISDGEGGRLGVCPDFPLPGSP